MRTKGCRRAVLAVARKLAVLLHRMWMDGTEFRQENEAGTNEPCDGQSTNRGNNYRDKRGNQTRPQRLAQ